MEKKWYEKEITWNDIKAFFSKVKPKTKSYNLNLEFLSGGKKPKITAHDRGKKMAECLPSEPLAEALRAMRDNRSNSTYNEYKARAEKETRRMKEEFSKQKEEFSKQQLLSIREYENYKRKAKTNMLDAQLEAKRYWDEIKRR